MFQKWILGALGSLAAATALAAGPSTTATQYLTNSDGWKVPATVIFQSEDGANASPINSTYPLPVAVVSTLTLSNSSAVESSHVFKASAGNLFGFHVTNGSVTGYVMFFDSATVPADGAVVPVICLAMPSMTSSIGTLIQPLALHFTKGIVAVYSTTGCFTKTASASAYFAAQVQ